MGHYFQIMIVVLDLLYYKDGTNLGTLLDDKDSARLGTLLCGILSTTQMVQDLEHYFVALIV